MEAETDPQSHKSKKKKRKTSTIVAEIKMLKEEPDKNAPYLGYYPSGLDPLSPEIVESNNHKFYRNQKKIKRVELVVKPTGFGVNYVGNNYSGEAASGRMNSFALCVVQKNRQSLTVVPITANKVFRLQPWVKGAQIADKEPDTPAKIDTEEERRMKQRLLTDRYGTKGAIGKEKKAMQRRQKEDPSAQEELNQILEETPVDKSALISSTLDTSRSIPPYDLSATTPEKAYLLDKIISKGEWEYVKDILELLQAGKEIKSDVYPSFVCNRLYRVELNKDESEKGRLAGILSYISHLVNYKDRNSIDGGSSKNQKFIPTILQQKFKTLFADPEKNRLSDEKIGSLISYVLVLTLFIDEFETDFRDIAKDLKMSPLRLRTYFKNLGCKFKRSKNVAFLSVPLSFPSPVTKRRRAGGR